MPEDGASAPDWVVEIIGENGVWCDDCSGWHVPDYHAPKVEPSMTISSKWLSEEEFENLDDGDYIMDQRSMVSIKDGTVTKSTEFMIAEILYG
jgi:hypothetical protein